MKGMLLRSVFRPLIERLGTMAAAYMIARGADSDLAAQLINALVAAACVGLDLITSALSRRYDAYRLLGHNGGPTFREDD